MQESVGGASGGLGGRGLGQDLAVVIETSG